MGGQTRLLLVAGQVLVNICACTTVEGSLVVSSLSSISELIMKTMNDVPHNEGSSSPVARDG